MTTLFQVQAAVIDYARQQDANDSTLAERVEQAVAALKAYVPADALNPRDTAEVKNAADTIKVQLREVYLESQRYTGRDRSGVVNMVFARQVAETLEADREKWADDAPERKVWDAMLAYCRNIWRDIANAAYPKPKADKPQAEEKHASADQVLATIKSFLAGNPEPILVKNVFDQIALLRPTK